MQDEEEHQQEQQNNTYTLSAPAYTAKSWFAAIQKYQIVVFWYRLNHLMMEPGDGLKQDFYSRLQQQFNKLTQLQDSCQQSVINSNVLVESNNNNNNNTNYATTTTNNNGIIVNNILLPINQQYTIVI
eukprot:UN01768